MRLQRRITTFFLSIALLAAVGMSSQAQAAPGSNSLFGSNEIRSPSLKSFTNWTGMLARFERSKMLGQGMCASAAGSFGGSTCVWTEWTKIIADLQNASPMEQLKTVNKLMNQHPYILDSDNWGMEDYWATAFEFLGHDGDCEDYAIAKYSFLRALGWPAEKLRIVIVHDTQLDLNHAILAAYTDDGVMIGDNQISGLARADRIHHYRPIYSINEQAWWLHRPIAH